MLLNLRFYETVTRNIVHINRTAGSVFLTSASLSGLIPLVPILQLLALPSRVHHHHNIKRCLFRRGVWFWEARARWEERRSYFDPIAVGHSPLDASSVSAEETEEGFCGLRLGLCLRLVPPGRGRARLWASQAAHPLPALEAGVGQGTEH